MINPANPRLPREFCENRIMVMMLWWRQVLAHLWWTVAGRRLEKKKILDKRWALKVGPTVACNERHLTNIDELLRTIHETLE